MKDDQVLDDDIARVCALRGWPEVPQRPASHPREYTVRRAYVFERWPGNGAGAVMCELTPGIHFWINDVARSGLLLRIGRTVVQLARSRRPCWDPHKRRWGPFRLNISRLRRAACDWYAP